MRKTREEKAITLIALIITIVVLLILAAVAINAVTGDGIIQHATNAKDEYIETQDKEELIIYMTEWQIAKKEEKSSLINYIRYKYGDSSQECEDGSVVLITDRGNTFGVTASGEVIESEELVLTVEQLQELYTFSYYDKLSLAITDANNSTTANANSNAENAVAGIYNNKGNIYVVLIKDTTESTRMILGRDVTINLGGNLLSVNGDKVVFDGTIEDTVTITIDGRLHGSGINIKNNDGNVNLIQTRLNNFNIYGGTYIANSTNGTARGIFNRGLLNLKNCNISVSSDKKAYGVYNSTEGKAKINDCEIFADSPYTNNSDNTGYDACSIGVYSYGEVSLTNCNTTGTQAGTESTGNIYIDGGTHKSYGHGGLYLTGENSQAYVKNATMMHWEYDGKYGPLVNVAGHAGGYIGYGPNIRVYMDNCDIYGKQESIVIKSANQNNILYISNSRINLDASIGFRIDSTNQLYIGRGCNFTADNTNNPSRVIITDEVYKK